METFGSADRLPESSAPVDLGRSPAIRRRKPILSLDAD